MASTARQSKPQRKGGAPEPARRSPAAWSTNARSSQTFSPSPGPKPANGVPAASFPPLGQANGTRQPDPQQERVLQSLSGLKGTTITLTTKSAQRYEGVISSVTTEGDHAGVTLKEVKEISTANAPTKDTLFVASGSIDSWTSGPAGSKMPSTAPNGDSFRTDTDISGKGGARRERELQAWQPSGSDAAPSTTTAAEGAPSQGDDLTFGPGSTNALWDQFSANEKLFGVKTGFDEDLYTTKLDRSAPDFKERERKAQKIANEIIGANTSNPHVAEERTMNLVDDSGMNEEDKYGAVVRGQNAYVPPGARRPGSFTGVATAPSTAKQHQQEIPKLSINGPDGTVVKSIPQSSPTLANANANKGSIPPAGTATGSGNSTNKPPADAFRDFVTNERNRLTQKKQALVKNEMERRMAELVKFSKGFKLNKPIPEDLVPILTKDEEKQKQIRDKAIAEAASEQARMIGGSLDLTNSQADATKKGAATGGPSTPAGVNGNKAGTASAGSKSEGAGAKSGEQVKKPAAKMVIQAIPPFKGPRSKQTVPGNVAGSAVGTGGAPLAAAGSGGASMGAKGANLKVVPPPVGTTGGAPPMSPTTANRLNVNASSFRPNPKASAFSPVSVSPSASVTASASVSPKPKQETVATSPNNPFFGPKPVKKQVPVNIKDDFNPFKHNKVVDAKDVAAIWPYNGKRYMQMFPPPQQHPPQHAPHITHPGPPPPMPPPTYDEDTATQAAVAAQRGYVYAYPPYGYPAQHMMPGMAPPGPPGAYMPGPFMQHMPYPPAMYASPAMGQMPPPQAYMSPPPQGPYVPQPNGAGPRPSMPPTPIPTHAHPYYHHQSPQLPHAVPYMMMPPPQPGVPPHHYDGASPVPMGHA